MVRAEGDVPGGHQEAVVHVHILPLAHVFVVLQPQVVHLEVHHVADQRGRQADQQQNLGYCVLHARLDVGCEEKAQQVAPNSELEPA